MSKDYKTVKVFPKVNTFDIDAMQHVSNIVYVQWLEIARCKLLEHDPPLQPAAATGTTI